MLKIFNRKYIVNKIQELIFESLKYPISSIKKDKYIDIIQSIFIVSTGRTGTKFLARNLDKIIQVNAKHEPYPELLVLANSYVRKDMDFNKVKKKIWTNRVIYLLKAIVKNNKFYIESNNRLYSLIPILNNLFQKAMFIHIVRDGRDVVRSGMNRLWFTDSDIHKIERLSAKWFKSDNYHTKWKDMSRFEKICWWWQKKDRIIYNNMKKVNSIRIKFEDIFSTSEHEGYKEILNFIDLGQENYQRSIFDKKININRKYEFPKWNEWSDKQKNQFDSICLKHMKTLGYY